MFTGIVERACPVISVVDGAASRRLVLDLSPLRQVAGQLDGPGPLAGLGDSIAVNGVCLTVSELDGDRASFDVITQTLSCTSLGGLEKGDLANVERALCFGARVDGHLVQGHVEQTGRVVSREVQPGQTWLVIACGPDFARRCLPKGSVAVDGVSLTVAELRHDAFAIGLVPHTLERTTLGRLQTGDLVNLEPDLVGQWVLRSVESLGLGLPGAG